MDIININNIDFSYYIYNPEENNRVKTKILHNIDLNVKSGEFLAILGHNGSGKSTLAKLMNSLLLPEEGNIIVFGLDTKDEENIWTIRQHVGIVFQNPDNQIIASIVEEDVAFGPENLGVDPKDIRKVVDESLKSVRMEDFKDRTPSLLSGGQKQRVAIAGVLAMKPKCIIFDESTSMLDPRGRKEVMETALRLNKIDNITVIIITHFMEEAVLADRVVVINEGEIKMSGSPKEIFSRVTELKKISLDVPQMAELAYNLRKNGVLIDENILTIEEMVEALCNYN